MMMWERQGNMVMMTTERKDPEGWVLLKIPQGDGGGAKIRSQVNWLKHVGARRGTAGWLCQKPESTG